jgi:hypothetical protein
MSHGTGFAAVELFPTNDDKASTGTPLPVRATFRVDGPSVCNCTAAPPALVQAHASERRVWAGHSKGLHCRRTATSTDQGLTFQGFWDQAELPDPGCKGGYARAPAFSAIVVGNDANSTTRENVTISVSLDNGVTYPHKHVVFAGAAGYVDVQMVSETGIGVLYEVSSCSMAFQVVDIRTVISGA